MKEELWKRIWKILTPWLKKRKSRNMIFIESIPDFTDNAKAVFEEMIRRGMNKKYRIIWCLNGDEYDPEIARIKNVSVLKRTRRIHKYVSFLVKVMISSNRFLPKRRDDQYHIGLSHGAAMKDCRNHYSLPKNVDEALTFSEYMAYYDAQNYNCDERKLVPLGYPRNDILFNEPKDLHAVFPDVSFEKMIYWLPTYRQHKNGRTLCSDTPMPIIYNEEIAKQINECVKEQNVLLVVKPHFAQDLSKIKEVQLSNLKFIDNKFLMQHKIDNYEMLGSAAALISDYSSVYYDYLLVDRPIGLCWDDFDSYNEMEGFTVDPHEMLAGGEKIYTKEDLCAFIKQVANGEDELKEIRNEIKNKVHLYTDNQSSKRVVDYIEYVLDRRFPDAREKRSYNRKMSCSEKKNKIGVINLHHTMNYGAIIAASVLEKTIQDIIGIKGGEVQTVRYYPQVESKNKIKKFLWQVKCANGLRGYLKTKRNKNLLDITVSKERERKFEDFRDKFLNCTNFCSQPKQININNDFKTFVVGSDVVWHPKRISSFCMDGYMLMFANKGEKRISYAASIDWKTNIKLKRLAGRYAEGMLYLDDISVREKESVEFLQKLTDTKIYQCCDPALLYSAEEYEPMLQAAEITNTDEKYIYVYVLDGCRSVVNYAKKLSERTGLKIYFYSPNKMDFGLNAVSCNTDGPADFLHRVKNASYVLSNSYHCAVFSVLFEKKFLTFDRGRTSIKTASFLKQVGLEDRIYSEQKDVLDEAIDFQSAKRVVETMKKDSLAYLERVLSDL